GEDFRNYTYARYGQEIMRQPLQVAFQLFDQKVVHLLKKPYTLPGTTRLEGETLEALARTARIEVATLKRTIAAYNAAVNGEEFNPAVKDGKAALGTTPPKSNWAQRLTSPPYLCFPVTCGITFTFGGLRIGPDAALINADDRKLAGLFACGELAAGLFYHNYPGGSGLMAGAVFGRLAGMGAAAYAGYAGGESQRYGRPRLDWSAAMAETLKANGYDMVAYVPDEVGDRLLELPRQEDSI